MKQLKIFLRLGGFIIDAIIIIQLNSCSIIGLGAGATLNAVQRKKITIPEELEIIKPDAKIDIFQKNGKCLTGTYSGIQNLPIEQYAETYTKTREQKPDGIFLPKLNDSIMLYLESGQHIEGEFLGFTYQDIYSISIKTLEGVKFINKPTKLNLIKYIEDSQNNILKAERINKLLLEGKIPILSAIVIKNETGYKRIAIDKVDKIHVKPANIIPPLFLLGIVVDMYLFIKVYPTLYYCDPIN